MNTDYRRYLGILMHITSLPSIYGIGELSSEAYRFADKVKKAGASLWQVLPLGPTGYGNSPYAARSAFAGNELLISLELLLKDGLLEPNDLVNIPQFDEEKVDFDKVITYKLPLLKTAAKNFIARDGLSSDGFRKFVLDSSYWLGDYAAFMVLYEKYNDARWFLWSEEDRRHSPKLVEKIREENGDLFSVYEVMQYFFSEQWAKFHTYCSEIGVDLIGDIPMFVGADSCDSWSHTDLLKCDKNGAYSAIAGVPPDNFSATGQLWGNPVYNWKECERTGYRWWIERLRNELSRVDVLRIDHFRGFDAYYEIKAGSPTAEHGKWTKAGGKQLFKTVRETLGDVRIIAEDLGLLTDSVIKLRTDNGFPGMKIAQFGFTRDEHGAFNPYDTFLPHNYTRDFVAYTGTHDNETTRGWFDALDPEDRHMVREYLSSSDDEIVWNLIRAIMMSSADYAIVPMQDILELGSWARMNFPSTCNEKNWAWRMKKDAFSDYRINRLALLSKTSGRNGLSYEERQKSYSAGLPWKEEK